MCSLLFTTLAVTTDPQQLVEQWGYIIVFLIVLAQCAGVPLPAVAVLLAAQAAARRGELSLPVVIAIGSIGAISGSLIGYIVGRIGGRPLMLKLAHAFHQDERRIDALDRFFRRHGGKAIFLGRWVIVVRLWGAIAAGAARMPWPGFVLWTVLGSILWVASLSVLAVALGSVARSIADYLDLGGWVLVPILAVGFYLAWRRRRRAGSRVESDPEKAGGGPASRA